MSSRAAVNRPRVVRGNEVASLKGRVALGPVRRAAIAAGAVLWLGQVVSPSIWKRRWNWIALCALLGFVAAVPAEAARVALVIGNADYRAPGALLTNSVGDARAVAAMLRELEFDVTEETDLSAEEAERVVNRFIRGIQAGDDAVFYYAGHGIEMSDGLQTSNYLLPVDVSLAWDKVQFRQLSLSASAVLERMELAGARVRILILDACRDNPFDGRSLGRGLGTMEPRGGLVAFAAEAGRTASDDGLFARHLVAALGEPGLPASLLFEQVGAAVARASDGGQRPAYYSAGAGGFVFRPDRDDSPAAVEAALGLDRAARREVQAGLLAEGYPVGRLDGEFGPRARDALGAWQVARGEAETGYLNEESATLLRAAARGLLNELERNASSLGNLADPPEVRTTAARETFRDCPWCPEMVVVPEGHFRMGCVLGRGCRDNELPVHEVNVESFALGVHEVKYEEYDRFVNATGRAVPSDAGRGRGNRPVRYVSWEDAVAYTEWLSSETDEVYRLPSEAQWEYAARAGTSTAYSWGNRVSDGRGQANCDACSSGGSIDEVGLFAANAWHLHDLHGNVAEWVEDCWHESYIEAPRDGSAWFSAGDCSQRVIRGGSVYSPSHYLRSAGRGKMPTEASFEALGFRVASVFDYDHGDRGSANAQFFGIEQFRHGSVDPLLWVASEESVAREYLGYGKYVEVRREDEVVFRNDYDGIGTTLLTAGIVQNEPGRVYLVSLWTMGAHSQFLEIHEIELDASREAREVFRFTAAYSVRMDVDEERLVASDGDVDFATFEFE